MLMKEDMFRVGGQIVLTSKLCLSYVQRSCLQLFYAKVPLHRSRR